jgi:hypothetical protein
VNPYNYTGEPGIYYPDLRLAPAPGVVYEFEECPPDGRWSPVTTNPPVVPAVSAQPQEAK